MTTYCWCIVNSNNEANQIKVFIGVYKILLLGIVKELTSLSGISTCTKTPSFLRSFSEKLT